MEVGVAKSDGGASVIKMHYICMNMLYLNPPLCTINSRFFFTVWFNRMLPMLSLEKAVEEEPGNLLTL